MSENIAASYTINPPASHTDIDELRLIFPDLPSAYFAFLQKNDGCEGDLGLEPGYVILWRAAEVELFTSEYLVPEYCPGYICIGSNGGGELFVVSLSGDPAGVFMVPASGMEPDALTLVADSFEQFQCSIGKNPPGA
jgi:hypothetical protein